MVIKLNLGDEYVRWFAAMSSYQRKERLFAVSVGVWLGSFVRCWLGGWGRWW